MTRHSDATKRNTRIASKLVKSVFVGVALLIIAYVMASILTWGSLENRFGRRLETTKAEFRQVIGDTSNLDGVSVSRVNKLGSEVGRVCRVPSGIEWQTAVLPPVQRNIKQCQKRLVPYRKALGAYREAAKFHAAEQKYADILRGAQTKGQQVTSADHSAQKKLWQDTTRSIRAVEVPDGLGATKVGLVSATEGIVRSWENEESMSANQVAEAYDTLASVQLTLASDEASMMARLEAARALID